ncbi:MAG: hypothetical protein QM723_34370 [Myxococcaceae bacterium]
MTKDEVETIGGAILKGIETAFEVAGENRDPSGWRASVAKRRAQARIHSAIRSELERIKTQH